jgi:TonB family protein
MWSAHERRHLDRRSLGLSIVLHLSLLLFLISQRHRLPIEMPKGPPDAPELILDLPELPPAPPENPAPPKNSAGFERARSKPNPSAVIVEAPVVESSAPPLLQPVVRSVVKLPELTSTKMPSSNPKSERAAGTAPGTTATQGATGNGTAATSGGGGPRGEADTAERPDWIEQPTMRERMSVLSIEAARDHANGWAVLSCLVTRSKRVRDCKVIGESRDSKGGRSYAFGASALHLARTFRVRPPKRNGRPRYDIRIRIPIYWSWKAPGN